ncbi:MAG: GNAT family N-acetyltransferase [Eubacteriales bacterium]|nr:GNAT family N-acetyltransferase [Eubacteriales bacterium]
MARLARPDEREALRGVWERVFPEDAGTEFVNWLFTKRYLPDWCVVAERAGRIAGVAHGFPLHMRVRDTILPCAVLSGVATEKAFRGQGVMREVITSLMDILRARGVPLLPHRPVDIAVYRSLGHYPVCDFQYVSLPSEAPRPFSDACLQTDMRAYASALYTCYGVFSKRYSCVIDRSYADFAMKLRDYASCDAQCLRVEEAGNVTGYCIYYAEEDGVYADECIALSATAYRLLYESFALRTAGRGLRMRLASDVVIPGAQNEIVPMAVLGVVDVQPLLRAAGLSGGSVEITDDVVCGNAGVVDLQGNPTKRPPQLRISAGRLAQWATGYRSIKEIVAAGQAAATDEAIIPLMDAAGTCPCYIVEEY